MNIATSINDIELLQRLKIGDETAFNLIYSRYWQGLFRSAYNKLRDKETCQDLVQELFTDIWKRREKLNTDNISAYLHAAINFLCYRQISKASRSSHYYEEFENVLQANTQSDGLVIEKEIRKLLDLWIAALPAKRREIFLFHYMEGLSTAEIAERMGISRKTVQNQLNTAYTEIHQKYAHFLSVVVILSGFYKNF